MRLKKISSAWTLALGGLLLAGSVEMAQAQCQANELAKLLASDGAPGDWLGGSVAVSGGIAVIGTHCDDDNGDSSGSAYVFRYDSSGWAQEAKLLPSDGAADDQFGISVGISGATAVVGARYDDDSGSGSGSAYVFRYDGSSWVEEAKLLASDGASGYGFGSSVAVSGDAVVVGAPYGHDNGSHTGSAYVFRYDGSSWVEEAKLLASDGAADDTFGDAVAISDDTAVIGAWQDQDNGEFSGSAYIFRHDGSAWVQEAKLLPSDGTAWDFFGEAVAISGDAAVIGANGDDDNGDGSGSAYVFHYDGSTWVEQAKLLASDGAEYDNFGFSVAISGDTAVVGAEHADSSGAAYVFGYDGSTWLEQAKLLPSDGTANDEFGRSVAISGDRAVIGADGDDDDGSNSGSAYIFHGLSDCQPNGTIDICDIADGTSEDSNANGVPDECEGCQANELAKLLASDGAAGDYFAWSVAVSGDTAVIGAHRNDDNGENSGSAYVFRHDGSSWIEEAKLLASDGAPGDYFGRSVAISADTAMIGAYGDDDNGDYSGSAYVFRYDGSTWFEEPAKLLPADGAPGDYFGRSAALFGDTAVIGADNHESAYVFRYDGSSWVEEAKLLPSDPPAANFGEFVSISTDCVVVGAWYDDDNGTGSGSAYVFRYDGSTWVEEAKLLASDGAPDDNFGNGVAVSGDCILVGGRGNDDNRTDSGSAYVFRYDGASWVEEAKLLASDGAEDDRFGSCVAVSGDIAVVGAYGDDDNGSRSGSAYVFRYDGSHWLEGAKLLPADGATEDQFAKWSAAISGDTAVIGALGNDDHGESSGSAYIFRGLSDCQPNGVLDICDIANATSQDDNGNGIPDECECPGDIDGDGDTDHSDLGELLSAWGSQPGDPDWNPNADLDGDGHVGHGDLGILLADWGCST